MLRIEIGGAMQRSHDTALDITLACFRRNRDVTEHPEKAANVPDDVFRLLFLEQLLDRAGERDTPRVHRDLHVPGKCRDELQGLGRIVGDVRIGAINQ